MMAQAISDFAFQREEIDSAVLPAVQTGVFGGLRDPMVWAS